MTTPTLTLAGIIEQRLQSLGRRSGAAAFERLQPFFRSLNFQVEETDRTEARDRFAQIVNSTAGDTDAPQATLVRKHKREDEAVLMISLDDLANAFDTLSHDLEAQMGQSRPLRGLLDSLTPIHDKVRPEFGTVNLETQHRHHSLNWSEQDTTAEPQPVGGRSQSF